MAKQPNTDGEADGGVPSDDDVKSCRGYKRGGKVTGAKHGHKEMSGKAHGHKEMAELSKHGHKAF